MSSINKLLKTMESLNIKRISHFNTEKDSIDITKLSDQDERRKLLPGGYCCISILTEDGTELTFELETKNDELYSNWIDWTIDNRNLLK